MPESPVKRLTDAGAVLAAIAEHDSIGREVFLDRYGFKKALRYYLVYEGRFYDSKAIVGAAIEHQTGLPGKSGLRGGLEVRRVLAHLGFDVRVGEPSQNKKTEIEYIDSEASNQQTFERSAVPAQTAVRRESKLVREFEDFLRANGQEICRCLITVASTETQLLTDTFNRTDNTLYEAKASADRGTMRLALGQVLDYRRYFDVPPVCRLLLPERPVDDLVTLLAGHGIGITWRDGTAWRTEN